MGTTPRGVKDTTTPWLHENKTTTIQETLRKEVTGAQRHRRTNKSKCVIKL